MVHCARPASTLQLNAQVATTSTVSCSCSISPETLVFLPVRLALIWISRSKSASCVPTAAQSVTVRGWLSAQNARETAPTWLYTKTRFSTNVWMRVIQASTNSSVPSRVSIATEAAKLAEPPPLIALPAETNPASSTICTRPMLKINVSWPVP